MYCRISDIRQISTGVCRCRIFVRTMFFSFSRPLTMKIFVLMSNFLTKFFHPTNIQNPADIIRRNFFGIWRIMDSNFRRSSRAGADLHIFRANGLVEFEHKSQKTRFHTIFVAFILRLAELFFLAGCAEPRCGDFKELNSNFKETHVFP